MVGGDTDVASLWDIANKLVKQLEANRELTQQIVDKTKTLQVWALCVSSRSSHKQSRHERTDWHRCPSRPGTSEQRGCVGLVCTVVSCAHSLKTNKQQKQQRRHDKSRTSRSRSPRLLQRTFRYKRLCASTRLHWTCSCPSTATWLYVGLRLFSLVRFSSDDLLSLRILGCAIVNAAKQQSWQSERADINSKAMAAVVHEKVWSDQCCLLAYPLIWQDVNEVLRVENLQLRERMLSMIQVMRQAASAEEEEVEALVRLSFSFKKNIIFTYAILFLFAQTDKYGADRQRERDITYLARHFRYSAQWIVFFVVVVVFSCLRLILALWLWFWLQNKQVNN